MIRKHFLTLFFAVVPVLLNVGAKELDDKDTAHIRFFDTAYKSSLGKRVMIDAVVWHYLGTSGRGGGEIITPTGQVIFVRDAYDGNRMSRDTQRIPQGKLVRVIGILELGRGPTAGGFVLATGDPRLKLNLKLESFEVIDTAEFPWPRKIK